MGHRAYQRIGVSRLVETKTTRLAPVREVDKRKPAFLKELLDNLKALKPFEALMSNSHYPMALIRITPHFERQSVGLSG